MWGTRRRHQWCSGKSMSAAPSSGPVHCPHAARTQHRALGLHTLLFHLQMCQPRARGCSRGEAWSPMNRGCVHELWPGSLTGEFFHTHPQVSVTGATGQP